GVGCRAQPVELARHPGQPARTEHLALREQAQGVGLGTVLVGLVEVSTRLSLAQGLQSTRLVNRDSPGSSRTISSPTCRGPTPTGVPVRITSPGNRLK